VVPILSRDGFVVFFWIGEGAVLCPVPEFGTY
jgi:hypothetical protein